MPALTAAASGTKCAVTKHMHTLLFGLAVTVGAVLTVHAVFLALTSNFNLGNLLVWLLAAFWWLCLAFRRPLWRWCTGTLPGRIVLAVFLAGAAVYAVLIGFVALSGHADTAAGQEQVMVVLGAGLHKDKPSRLLRFRLDAAYTFAAAHPEMLVITTGGQGIDEALPEGQAMRDYLVAKGLDPQRVLAETKSTSTEENFLFAREILAARGLSADVPTVYVTNAFHCYRAGRYATMAGFTDAHALPARTPLSGILPSYLREALAVLYYWCFRRVDGGPLQGVVGLMALQKRIFYK